MRPRQPEPDDSELAAAKVAARAAARRVRAEVSPAVRATATTAITARLLALVAGAGARRVGVYAAAGSEVDVDGAAEAWLREGLVVAYPRVTGPHTMVLHAVTAVPRRIVGPHGIRESDAGPEVEVEVLVVPGVAFDREGGRLGQGGGYYDRFLGARTSGTAPTTVGVGFAAQLVDLVPTGPNDVRLDAVLTEDGVYR